MKQKKEMKDKAVQKYNFMINSTSSSIVAKFPLKFLDLYLFQLVPFSPTFDY